MFAFPLPVYPFRLLAFFGTLRPFVVLRKQKEGKTVAVEVTMPKFGLTMTEGTIQKWFKNEGDAIKAGESLFEVETEKVLYEVESRGTGTVAKLLYPLEAVVAVGLPVAVIAEAGENVAEVAANMGVAHRQQKSLLRRHQQQQVQHQPHRQPVVGEKGHLSPQPHVSWQKSIKLISPPSSALAPAGASPVKTYKK